MIKIHLHNSKVDDIHAFIQHARWKWRKSRTRMARFREFPRQESRHVHRSIEDARLYTVKARNQPVNVVKRAVWFAARSVLDRYASAEDQTRYFDIENESYAENKLDSKIISILPCLLLRCELSCIWLCEFPRIRSDFWSVEEEAEDQIRVAKKPNWSTRLSRLLSREREFTKKIESLIARISFSYLETQIPIDSTLYNCVSISLYRYVVDFQFSGAKLINSALYKAVNSTLFRYLISIRHPKQEIRIIFINWFITKKSSTRDSRFQGTFSKIIFVTLVLSCLIIYDSNDTKFDTKY